MNAKERRKSKRMEARGEPRDEEKPSPAGGNGKPVTVGVATSIFGTNAKTGEALVESVMRQQRPRRKQDEDEDVFDQVNFRKIHNSWLIDIFLPDYALPYFTAAFVICTLVWLTGLVIRLATLGAGDVWGTFLDFVQNREWQTQPFLLFAHFIALRVFKGIYSRNFDRAFAHLDVTRDTVEKYRTWIYGQRVNFGALLLSLPFIAYKVLVYFPSDQFLADYRLEYRGGEAFYLLGIWCAEWLIFGYYCYLILAGAIITRRILKKHQFIESVDLVLAERHYSPLFNTTAQSGTLVFFFAVIHAGYVFYVGGDWGDYIGLAALVVLLAFSFLVTWSSVRATLRNGVRAATDALERSYRQSREVLAAMMDKPGVEDDLQRVQIQLKMSLALQQAEYLILKYESVGRREMTGMMFRMVAPVGTVLARLVRWGALLAALGLGSASIFSNEQPKEYRRRPRSNVQTPR